MKTIPFIFLAALLAFAGCATPATHSTATAPLRSSVTQAATATAEATKASQRSSVHIREFRSDAEKIDYKASRALRILDHP
jgi:uncharacterized lipoprotein YajG